MKKNENVRRPQANSQATRVGVGTHRLRTAVVQGNDVMYGSKSVNVSQKVYLLGNGKHASRMKNFHCRCIFKVSNVLFIQCHSI